MGSKTLELREFAKIFLKEARETLKSELLIWTIYK